VQPASPLYIPGGALRIGMGEKGMTTGIVVMGGSGRMGRMLCEVVAASDDARLIGVTEAPGHPWVRRDLGEALGGAANGVPVTDDPIEVVRQAQAVIDFTTPAATLAMSEMTAQARAVHVIGTTGLSEDDLAVLDRAARHATIVRAGNMSLGVNLLTQLVREVAGALGDEFDVEVVEAHHRHKVDAPSGTALMLGEAAAEGRGVALDAVADRGRDGITGPRGRGRIGFHAVRGGDVVGEHDVIFAGDGERIVLRHVASDRTVFARGALRAALWGQGRGPGAFDMLDVLGLRR
jgi:4-hydroxy-tetrahydrodipicolinate reductase